MGVMAKFHEDEDNIERIRVTAVRARGFPIKKRGMLQKDDGKFF